MMTTVELLEAHQGARDTPGHRGPFLAARCVGPTGASAAQGERGLEGVDGLVPRAPRRASVDRGARSRARYNRGEDLAAGTPGGERRDRAVDRLLQAK